MENHLDEHTDRMDLLPGNLGIDDQGVSSLIQSYNELVLRTK